MPDLVEFTEWLNHTEEAQEQFRDFCEENELDAHYSRYGDWDSPTNPHSLVGEYL